MLVKPFLFITTRTEEDVAVADYNAFLRYSGLRPGELEFLRLDINPLPVFSLQDYSGIILGGSPLNVSDEVKTDNQQRIEADLASLLTRVLEADFPFFGACFGIGVLGQQLGGVVDDTYGEPVSAPVIELTDQGRSDPLLQQTPHQFHAYVGHKEALSHVPGEAVVLATSHACPVQMFRVGSNIYATQFHPELDIEVLTQRVYAYLDHGYINPDEAEGTLAELRNVDVQGAHQILRAFIHRYRQDAPEGSTTRPVGG